MIEIVGMETSLWGESSTGTLEDDGDAGRVKALFTSDELASPALTRDEEQALEQALEHLSLEAEGLPEAAPEALPNGDHHEPPIDLPYGPVGSAIRIINRASRAARKRVGAPPLRPVVLVYMGGPRFSTHMVRNVGGAVRGVEVQVGGPAIESGLVHATDVYIETLTGHRPSHARRRPVAGRPSTLSFDEVVVPPAPRETAQASYRLQLEEQASFVVRLRIEGRRVGFAELHLWIGEPGKVHRLRREMVVVESHAAREAALDAPWASVEV